MAKLKLQIPIAQGCVIRDEHVLLVQRNEPSLPGLHRKWELPGGKIEFGEDPASTCRREISEETGVQVDVKEMIPFPYVAVRHQKHRVINVIVFCYVCEFTGELVPREEKKISDIRWIKIADLDPVLLQSGTFQFIKHVTRPRGGVWPEVGAYANTHFVTLRSINQKSNRLRRYSVMIESDISTENSFRLQCVWGRLGHNNDQSSTQFFKKRDDMLATLSRILTKRLQHHYAITEISDDFPHLEILDRFSKDGASKKGSQLSLFSAA